MIECILVSFSDKVNEQTFPPVSCVYTETHDQQLCMIYYTKVFFLFLFVYETVSYSWVSVFKIVLFVITILCLVLGMRTPMYCLAPGSTRVRAVSRGPCVRTYVCSLTRCAHVHAAASPTQSPRLTEVKLPEVTHSLSEL